MIFKALQLGLCHLPNQSKQGDCMLQDPSPSLFLSYWHSTFRPTRLDCLLFSEINVKVCDESYQRRKGNPKCILTLQPLSTIFLTVDLHLLKRLKNSYSSRAFKSSTLNPSILLETVHVIFNFCLGLNQKRKLTNKSLSSVKLKQTYIRIGIFLPSDLQRAHC